MYDLGMRDEVGIERPKPFHPALNDYFGLKYRVDYVGAIGTNDFWWNGTPGYPFRRLIIPGPMVVCSEDTFRPATVVVPFVS